MGLGFRVWGLRFGTPISNLQDSGLGFRALGFKGFRVVIYTAIMENQMEKRMENEMETAIYIGILSHQ